MVYPPNGILFDNKKRWSTDICCNMDESWKRYAKWKKPVTKEYTWFYLYEMPGREKSVKKESGLIVA